MHKRIFISIDLPKAIQAYFQSLQKPDIYWIKWMKPQNLHITLNFLGELKPREIEEAKLVIAGVAPTYRPFPIKLGLLKQERDMLWVMPEDPVAISEIQNELKFRLKHARLGKTERRGYQPHILFCKSKTGRRMTWKPQHFKPVEFMAERVNLYESELTPGAATHRLIQSFALNQTQN